ncbi:hypothetical protein ACSBR1_020572 [Camellia fascicularis]
MPDDILSFILSFLSIRDSVKARILSRRWKYICPFMLNLDFDLHIVLGINYKARYSNGDSDISWEDKSKFVTGVDQFLELYNGQRLLSLRICFCLGNEYAGYVDRRIRFAIIMKTEKLDLDFSASPESQKHVPLNQSCANSILSSCLNLEWLRLKNSILPETLCIHGPSLHLKILIVHKCYGVKQFEIFSISLTTFAYIGKVKYFSFLDVPRLEKVHIRYIAKTLYGDDDEEVTPQNSDTVEEPKCLGLYPGSNEKFFLILLKNGPYGFCVQLGEDRKGYLPKRASVPQGNHPDDGQPVVLKLEKFGFSIRHRHTIAPVPENLKPNDITFEKALELLLGKDVKRCG